MADESFEFVLNGERVRVEGVDANQSLLNFLRSTGHTGSKEGCAEGDCGACSVVLLERDATGKATYRAITSCITLLPMVAGREVVTVEGVGRSGLHPIQEAMVEYYGSQCGYCTPGFVMSMFEAYYREDVEGGSKLCDQLCGNLCRCTGYRPIREAAQHALAVRDPKRSDLFQLSLRKPPPVPGFLDYVGRTYDGEVHRFYRPTSLEELLRLRAELPNATLVAGATEIGVEINKKGKRFPVLISIEGVDTLTRVERVPGGLRVGGAATLTALEEVLGDDLPALNKMLRVFASRQIRNRATLAGNLVTASPIGDTPPVLLVLDAVVTLASVRGRREVPVAEFFTGYRSTVLAPDEIVEAIFLPFPPPGTRMESYKVSKRRELDISIVAAAFRVELSTDGRITLARLAYGGVAATPVRARKAEAFLEGKPWNRATLMEALPVLASEFSPIEDVRSGVAFRQGLVTSLFEKFFHGEESEGQDLPLDYARETPWPQASEGRELRHESAVGHVTGRAVYVHDQAMRREMLELWPVTSPHAHARVLRIDTTKAAAMPGVVRVLTARDIPGVNDVGAVRHDETLLAADEVLFHGHMVAVVIATSLEAARRAAAVVEVDYEPLPAILGLKEAIRVGSYHTSPHVIRRGDVNAALASSPERFSGEIEIGGQEHFYLESQAAWAECGDDGDVYVVSSTQHPSEVQAIVSHVLGLPRNKVVVQSPRMGGAFGGKETQGASWASLVALSAWLTRRPTRIQLDRDLDMMLTGKRHPFHASYEVGFERDGKLRALRAQVTNDGGWALDLSESICDRALFHIDNSYYLPAVEVVGRVAKTNTVSHTAFRGFGGPQGMVVIEEILDRIARYLGLPPETVRERNLYGTSGEESTTHYGQLIEDNRVRLVWSGVRSSSKFDERRQEIASFNAKSQRIKRGLAITPVKFGISFTATFLNQAGALVLIYRDGTVQVNHGGTEMGQGLFTKIQGIAARELGVPPSHIRVMKTQTDKVPNTSATAASSGSDLNGAAVKAACEQLRERLAPVAADLLGYPDPSGLRFHGGQIAEPGGGSIPFATAVEAAYMRQVSLSATGFYRTPGIGYDKAKGRGKPFYYFVYGAAVTEVEVDGWSGMKRVRRVDILHDVGESLNPGVDRGQIEGGFVQGMGWLTGEELKWTRDGRLLTHSASTYQIPSIGDAPSVFHVELLPRAEQAGVIHGSKAVGEPPLMLALSVREAIRDAIAAFGAPGGEVVLPSPATHEAIFLAVQQRLAPSSSERLAAQ
ncbi:MAG: xanthine dehydrogenase molybdopterin binding subunit [Myxococcales bacterium]|nr:xanthine dehydrogenase molybdopterin binding subunit [Polyangiaceae bacterium]MDW8249318.1 xanthine dehydrogenase molybdopterin binding subunit [Myxococcales bacterium]